LGLEIAQQLIHQHVSVAIGTAARSTFCGVTGCPTVACQWDIIGGPPVRATRFMQYALDRHIPIAIDESVYSQIHYVSSTGTHGLLPRKGSNKGTPEHIQSFTLLDENKFAAMNLLETVHGKMHNPQVELITQHINNQTNAR
jgi:hypothetical protein